ncbi:hypothetical protein G7009_20970 [Pseudomonas capeferrum]|nr:hypothetical protein [Pseudomonas capeferrum]
MTRLLPLALLSELLALSTRSTLFSLIAAVLFGLFFIRHWHSLMPYPRRLGLATLALLGIWLVKAPVDLPTVQRMSSAAAYYAAFIGGLGLVGCLVKRLPSLHELHRFLLQGPRSLFYPRYLLAALGLGSILSFGMLNLMSSTLHSYLQHFPAKHPAHREGRRGVLTAAIRGFALVPLMAPTSIVVAIITREVPSLTWPDLLPYGAVATLVLMLIGWRTENRHLQSLCDEIPEVPATSLNPLVLGTTLGIAAIVALASLTWLNITQAALVVVPCLVSGWLFLESPGKAYDELAEYLAGMRNEIFIFACSALFGALFNQLFSLDHLAPLLGGSSQIFLLQCAALLGIVGMALIGIAPIITISICAGLLAQLQTAGINPLGPAVTLVCAFSLAMLLSPFGPAVLILARNASTSPWKIVFSWNGYFALIAIPTLLLLSWLVQWTGWRNAVSLCIHAL